MTKRSSLRSGLVLVVLNTVIGALQPVITRYGALHLDPLLFCTGAAVLAGSCVVPVLYKRGELGFLVDRRYLPRLFWLSMAGTVATSLCLIYGLKRINAITGVLLLQTEPVYSLLLATLVVGERPSARQLVATATILAGVGSVVGTGGILTASLEVGLILLTPLFWQAAHVLSLPVMPPLTPTCITGARYIYAALVMGPLLLLVQPNAFAQLADPRAWSVIGATGVLVYFVGSLSWYGAINRLSLAWTTALVVPGVPLLSILFAIVFLGEHTTLGQALGIVVAVSGVLGLVTFADPHRRRPAAETLESVHEPIA